MPISVIVTVLGFLIFGVVVIHINNRYLDQIKKKEWNQLKVYKEKQ
ncbi:hypothetical protein ACFWM3_14695 [Gottfriedia sp. NPDC058432]